MKRKQLSFVLVLVLSNLVNPPVFAAIDLQADLDRIVVGIRAFDSNSAATASVTTVAGMKVINSKNVAILSQIRDANMAFKRDLNRAKQQIPSRDTKASPSFKTLLNLTKGYEEWLKYQEINQVIGEKCITKAKNSFSAFTNCLLANFSVTMENERIGKMKLQTAWDAWKKWQVKYGYA